MRFLLTTLVLLLAVGAYAAPSNSAVLSRVKSMVQRAEGQLRDAEKWLEPGSKLSGSAGKLESVQKILAEIDTKLSSVAEQEPGRGEVAAQVDALKAKFAELSKRQAGADANKAAAGALLESGAQEDMAVVEGLAGDVRALGNLVGADDGDIETIRQWPAWDKQGSALVDKYGEARGQSADAKKMVVAVAGLRNALSYFKSSSLPTFTQEAPAQIDRAIAALQQHVKNAQANKEYHLFTGVIPSGVKSLAFRLDSYESLSKGQAGFSPDALARGRAAIADIEKTGKELADQIIKTNLPPKELYAGADKENLRTMIRAAWVKQNPSTKVVKIILASEGWVRRAYWRFNDSSLRWNRYDSSATDAWVLIASADGKRAFRYRSGCSNDHLGGGGVKCYPDTVRGEPTSPEEILLMANVK